MLALLEYDIAQTRNDWFGERLFESVGAFHSSWREGKAAGILPDHMFMVVLWVTVLDVLWLCILNLGRIHKLPLNK